MSKVLPIMGASPGWRTFSSTVAKGFEDSDVLGRFGVPPINLNNMCIILSFSILVLSSSKSLPANTKRCVLSRTPVFSSTSTFSGAVLSRG